MYILTYKKSITDIQAYDHLQEIIALIHWHMHDQFIIPILQTYVNLIFTSYLQTQQALSPSYALL